MNENEISRKILDCSFKIHSSLGPGLLESAYQDCLFYKLTNEGLYVEREKKLPLIYEEVQVSYGYRIDLLVEQKVVVELKSVEMIHPLHLAQMLTYLRLGNFKLGLLLNFNATSLNHGIKRVVNNL